MAGNITQDNLSMLGLFMSSTDAEETQAVEDAWTSVLF